MQSEVALPAEEEVKIVYTPFKELKPVTLKEEDVEVTVDQLRSELNPTAHWIGIFQAIDKLREILKGSYPLIAPLLHTKLVGEIKAGILNLRSTIAKNSLLLV